MPRIVDAASALVELETFVGELAHRHAGCAMCALGDASFRPADVVHAERDAVVRVDRFAVARGHVLVVSTAHVERAEALDWARYGALQRLAWQAGRAVAAVVAPHRVWIAALGSPDPLPMSSPHVHVHVIPVTVRGEDARPARLLSWSAGVTLYDDGEAADLTAALRVAWPRDAT